MSYHSISAPQHGPACDRSGSRWSACNSPWTDTVYKEVNQQFNIALSVFGWCCIIYYTNLILIFLFSVLTVQYLSRKNIKVFLDTCRSQFGLKDADLFHIPDLLDGTDFVKVNIICCWDFCNQIICGSDGNILTGKYTECLYHWETSCICSFI